MSDIRSQKAERFLSLHQKDGCFLMPNVWDAGSAKMLASVGFETIATTSAGVAFSLGKPDNGFCSAGARVDRDTMVRQIRSIADAVSIPVSADLEGGFGDTPEDVAETIRRAMEAGAVGGNIEDYTGSEEQPLYENELAVERIAAARQAINSSKIHFVLVARTDRLIIGRPGGVAEAIERANLYREAGADCLFIPGASDPTTISQLVREIDGPLSVVMGLTGGEMTLAQLQDLGVRRVSIGGSLARAIYYQMREAAQEMISEGTFSFAKQQLPQAELNRVFESDL